MNEGILNQTFWKDVGSTIDVPKLEQLAELDFKTAFKLLKEK